MSYPEYNGFQRSYTPKQDWSGFSKLNMFLKADGSDHKFVVQVNAGGVTFEAYPKIDGTDGHVVSLNFGDADGNGGDFAPASWDTAHAGMKLSQKLLSKVGSFALYINDNGGNRPKSGDLTLDSIKLDELVRRIRIGFPSQGGWFRQRHRPADRHKRWQILPRQRQT